MICIGITGGIGSGKSFVCSLFKKKNVPIFYADDVAKKISERPNVMQEIIDAFGKGIITSDHHIDRKKLASLVFAEHKKLQVLNSILHPKVFLEFDTWKSSISVPSTYVLVEAALMFESGMDEKMDYTLSVLAEEELRITRVMERDKVTHDAVRSRMTNQLAVQELVERSDFTIQNDGSTDELQAKVNFLHILFSTLQQRKELE